MSSIGTSVLYRYAFLYHLPFFAFSGWHAAWCCGWAATCWPWLHCCHVYVLVEFTTFASHTSTKGQMWCPWPRTNCRTTDLSKIHRQANTFGYLASHKWSCKMKKNTKKGAPGYQLCHSQASVLLNGLVSRFHLTNSLRRIKENANNTISRNKEQLVQPEKFAEFTPYSKVIQHLTNPWAHFYPTVRSSKTSDLKSCLKPKDAAPDWSSFGQEANPATMPLQRSLKPWGFQSIQGACDGHCVECGAAKQETLCLADKTDLHSWHSTRLTSWLTQSRWATSTFGAFGIFYYQACRLMKTFVRLSASFDLGYLGMIN